MDDYDIFEDTCKVIDIVESSDNPSKAIKEVKILPIGNYFFFFLCLERQFDLDWHKYVMLIIHYKNLLKNFFDVV